MSQVKQHAEALATSIKELDKTITERGKESEKLHQELRAYVEERDRLREALRCLARVSRDTDAMKECANVSQFAVGCQPSY